MPQPNGIVTVRINRDTGLRAQPNDVGAIFELFKEEELPGSTSTDVTVPGTGTGAGTGGVNDLF
jgi:penicillin-binding protein 1A